MKIKLILINSFLIFLLVLPYQQNIAQSGPLSSYAVQVGDTRTYHYISYFNKNSSVNITNPINESNYQFNVGINESINEDIAIEISVITINESSNVQTVYVQTTFNESKTRVFADYDMIIPLFTNTSLWQAIADNGDQYNIYGSSIFITNYTLDGNIFTKNLTYIMPKGYTFEFNDFLLNFSYSTDIHTFNLIISYDITTGWPVYHKLQETFKS